MRGARSHRDSNSDRWIQSPECSPLHHGTRSDGSVWHTAATRVKLSCGRQLARAADNGYRLGHADPTWPRYSDSEPPSKRTNLSPFTKDFRGGGSQRAFHPIFSVALLLASRAHYAPYARLTLPTTVRRQAPSCIPARPGTLPGRNLRKFPTAFRANERWGLRPRLDSHTSVGVGAGDQLFDRGTSMRILASGG